MTLLDLAKRCADGAPPDMEYSVALTTLAQALVQCVDALRKTSEAALRSTHVEHVRVGLDAKGLLESFE